MQFRHIIPDNDTHPHIYDRCCECEPYIDHDDVSTFHHHPFGEVKRTRFAGE